MAIPYRVNRRRRLVVASPRGALTGDEMFAYQREAWSRPEVAGFDELIDLTRVTTIEFESPTRVRELVDVSATMDRAPSKLAIVAKSELEAGLAKLYEAFRSLHPRSQREVRVFRDVGSAEAWLGVGNVGPKRRR